MFLVKTQDRLPGEPKCPVCETILDAYTHIGLENKKVKSGSICICAYCGTALAYVGVLGIGYRQLDEEELFVARFNPEFRKAEEASRQFRKWKQQ